MELFSNAWWSALLAIVLIDLVLAGDNAIVIALAARNVPDHLRKKTILWGTAGAIGVRTVMTLGVVWLLQIPGLMLVGGLGLVWVAYKLLADQAEQGHEEGGAHTFWGAMKTIIVADALMGIDNVLGVAGAAHGAMDLVVIGLLVSVPIVVFGSSVVLRLKLSVESNHKVTTRTSASSHQPRNSIILLAPALCPFGSARLGFAFAQRRLPSRMTPTW